MTRANLGADKGAQVLHEWVERYTTTKPTKDRPRMILASQLHCRVCGLTLPPNIGPPVATVNQIPCRLMELGESDS